MTTVTPCNRHDAGVACAKPAEFIYTAPGREPRPVCAEHAAEILTIGKQMDFPVLLDKLEDAGAEPSESGAESAAAAEPEPLADRMAALGLARVTCRPAPCLAGEAVQVPPKADQGGWRAIAEWSGGLVIEGADLPVHLRIGTRYAGEGDYVLRNNDGAFIVFSGSMFNQVFELVD